MWAINLPPRARSFLERHHVAGRVHDGRLRLPLCLTCHAIVTELLRGAGVSMDPAAHVLDRVAMILRALGTFFPDVGKACDRWAGDVARLAAALDARYPGWADMPNAK